ncbi:MAG: sigma-70 family RNA polymerase sigma factor [Lachnospiraceae bacterium]|nr:sigma-70 family RNA polymerase sigma factor [Lachnospiraceae bacterium]
MELLIRRVIRGDTDAFIELMEENKRMLYKVAKGYLRSEEDIADVLQDTVLAAFEHIGELKKPAYFRTWLTRILINRCLDIIRDGQRMAVWDDMPEQIYFNQEMHQLEFMQSLELLPEDSSMIFLLYYGEKFRTKEIAELLNINENTVKTKLRRGRQYLADVIQ